MLKRNLGWLTAGMLLTLAGVLSGCGSGILPTVEAATQSALTIQVDLGQTHGALQNLPEVLADSVGDPVSYRLVATGGLSPYLWTVAEGSLPTGVALSSDGSITGSLSVAGSWSAKLQVADSSSSGKTKSQNISFNVSPSALSISTTSMTNAQATTGYITALQATGGTPAYTWALKSGALPSGLTLSKSGVVSGTPASAGTSSFTAAVSDSGNPTQQATKSFTMTVTGAPLQITSSNVLNNARVGDAYSTTLAATGGKPGYTWSVKSGSLPKGMSLSTTGVLSGTPTIAGVSTFIASVSDASSPTQASAKIMAINTLPLAVSIGTAALSGGQAGAAYSATLAASGGVAPYTWNVVSGTLPAGLTLSSAGTITGTPTAPGTFSFAVKAADVSSSTQDATKTLSITISAASLFVTTASLNNGQTGSSYAATLAASGGTAPYRWTVSSGTLPAGLSLSSAGTISGTPTSTGTSNFAVKATDSASSTQSSTKSLSLTVAAAGAALKIGTSGLSNGQVSAAYTATLTASGGTTPYTWGLASGTLPAGLTLSSTGTISGAPTAAGTSTFTVKATDNSSSAQTATAAMSMTVAAAPLTITTGTIASGQSGTAYATQLSATGGTQAYTWSIASGSLPGGLTLGATTGLIQGTPTTTANSTFTYKVTDNSSPQQSVTAPATIAITAAPAQSGPTTWYVRTDGGTRYDASSNPTGQCDGKADAAYKGAGINQHCAFNDYRLLYDNHEYHNRHWIIAGGDTVILGQNSAGWRVGFDGINANDSWCIGDDGNMGCFNPTVPAGTALQHTRILGANYASCSAKSAMTQLFGGHGALTALNLDGAQYVDVQCIEITDHSNCVTHGYPALPRSCNKDYGSLDDFDSDGIITNTSTHDLLLKDLWIHGHTDRGIIGPIGGLVTADNIDIDKNAMAGWDFDPGNGTASVNSTLIFKNSIIEWSGCNEQYPLLNSVPVSTCYSQSTGGYGDGIGTPAGMGMNVTLDHSIFRYNTQDGEDFGHIDSPMQNGQYGSLTITNSQSYGNSGQQFKWGPAFMNITFTNNVVEANCQRLSGAFPGAPSDYNANLGDFCRAFDAMSFNFINGSNALFSHNTIVTYAQTTLDMKCLDGSGCANTVFTLSDNVLLAYSNPSFQYNGWGKPAVYCGAYCNETTLPIGTINRYNNMYYNFRACPAGGAAASSGGIISGESCLDPLLTNEPASFVSEATFDNIDAALSNASPARGAGTVVTTVLKDSLGIPWNSPPSIGALEYVAAKSFKLTATSTPQ